MFQELDVNKLIDLADKTIRSIYVDPDGKPYWLHCTGTNALRMNCVPVHFAIINEVRKIYPKAQVVIGCLFAGVENVSEERIKILKNYHNNLGDMSNVVHAWISLNIEENDSDILDITTPVSYSFKGAGLSYFDKEIAQQKGLVYKPVLKNADDVYNFFAHFAKERIRVNSKQGELEDFLDMITVQNNLKEKLRPVSESSNLVHLFKRLLNRIS